MPLRLRYPRVQYNIRMPRRIRDIRYVFNTPWANRSAKAVFLASAGVNLGSAIVVGSGITAIFCAAAHDAIGMNAVTPEKMVLAANWAVFGILGGVACYIISKKAAIESFLSETRSQSRATRERLYGYRP